MSEQNDIPFYGISPLRDGFESFLLYERFMDVVIENAKRGLWMTLPNGTKTMYVGTLEAGGMNDAGEFVPIGQIDYGDRGTDTPHIVEA